jgi:hypothetical protein
MRDRQSKSGRTISMYPIVQYSKLTFFTHGHSQNVYTRAIYSIYPRNITRVDGRESLSATSRIVIVDGAKTCPIHPATWGTNLEVGVFQLPCTLRKFSSVSEA